MKKIYSVVLFLIAFFLITAKSFSQTNPTAQSLPYSQDFNALSSSSSTYPDGWQGWTVATAPGSVFNTAAPTANQSLIASGTAANTGGGVYNYNTKIGLLNTGSLDLSVALALNTTGQVGITVNYDIMTIRNPY